MESGRVETVSQILQFYLVVALHRLLLTTGKSHRPKTSLSTLPPELLLAILVNLEDPIWLQNACYASPKIRAVYNGNRKLVLTSTIAHFIGQADSGFVFLTAEEKESFVKEQVDILLAWGL